MLSLFFRILSTFVVKKQILVYNDSINAIKRKRWVRVIS